MTSAERAAVRRVGAEFARDFYGRLNETGRARAVAHAFDDRVRYYAMDDAADVGPAVGRDDAVDALRRFCRRFGGGCGGLARRTVAVASVDALKDGDDRYELFVRAEWTSSDAPSPPTPFVQTFSLRRRRTVGRAADRPGQPFVVIKTTVKALTTETDDCQDGESSSLAGDDCGPVTTLAAGPSRSTSSEPTADGPSSEPTANGPTEAAPPSGPTAAAPQSKPTAAAPPSRPTVAGPTANGPSSRPTAAPLYRAYNRSPAGSHGAAGRRPHGRLPPYQEYEAYQKRVATFLAGADDGSAPPARLLVHGLDASFTVDHLYAAFGRFGTVLWARIERRYSTTGPTDAVRHVGHLCFERADALHRAMAEQRGSGGLSVSGVRATVSRFVADDAPAAVRVAVPRPTQKSF